MKQSEKWLVCLRWNIRRIEADPNLTYSLCVEQLKVLRRMLDIELDSLLRTMTTTN